MSKHYKTPATATILWAVSALVGSVGLLAGMASLAHSSAATAFTIWGVTFGSVVGFAVIAELLTLVSRISQQLDERTTYSIQQTNQIVQTLKDVTTPEPVMPPPILPPPVPRP